MSVKRVISGTSGIGLFCFLACAKPEDDAGRLHNHRALLWYQGDWGRSHQQAMSHLKANGPACNYHEKLIII